MNRLGIAMVVALGIATGSVWAQLPPDAVMLDKVKVPQKQKSHELCPVHLVDADPAVPTWEHNGVTYGGHEQGCEAAFAANADAFAMAADKQRWENNFVEALIYVALTLPSSVYENIGFSALVGCLIGLGALASSSELVVMRAAGVSVAQITWAVMKPVLLFIVMALLLGEYVTPLSDQVAESRRAIAQGDTRALESKHGLWNREGNEFMHFNAVLPNGKLYGVTRYNALHHTLFVERPGFRHQKRKPDDAPLHPPGLADTRSKTHVH